MTQYTEQTLAQEIKSNNLKAFEYAFNTYANGLIEYATTLLKDADDAEDIVQQLLVQLWVNRSELNITSSLKGYLYRSVHNSCLNEIKKQKVRNTYGLQQSVRDTAKAVSVAEVLENKEMRLAIEKALADLPELCQVIFIKAKYEFLKYQEIADELGIPTKTVENQMGKALKLLREKLKHLMPLVIIQIIIKSL